MQYLPNTAQIGLWISCTGNIPISLYNQRIPFPTNSNGIVKFLVSTLGGTVVWKDSNDNVLWMAMLPGREYAVYDVKVILSSGTDWQGNSVTNNITDLRYYGE